MSTLSIHPSAAVQFAAMASRAATFVRRLFTPAPADSSSADLRTLYRLSRGRDTVQPAVARHLDAHAQAK